MLFSLIFLTVLCLSCTKESPQSIHNNEVIENVSGKSHNEPVAQNQKEENSEGPADNALVIPLIPGLIIRHSPQEKSEKSGTFSYVADLQIIEQQSGKMLAEFPERVWGKVPVKVEERSIGIFFADEDGSEFEYRVKRDESGKVIETAKCYFYEGNNKKSSFEFVFPSDEDKDVDWESTVAKLSKLARIGNSFAFNFFMNPTPEQKKFHKYDDGAASFKNIQTILRFMKKQGCKW